MNNRSQAGEPAWMDQARALVGLKEKPGSAHESRIVEFFAEAGHAWVKDDETAWCAAFANAMLKRAGVEGTGKLNARSFLDWGAPLNKPRVGCVVVFSRGNPKGWQGHVGFYVGEDSRYIRVLGGNQSNAVTISRYSKSRLLGYRWPEGGAAGSGDDEPAEAVLVGVEIERLQTALKNLGYHEVGQIDGLMGRKTRGALLAFKADAGLPLTPDVDDETWAALAKAAPRELPGRQDVAKPPSAAAKAADVAKKLGAGATAVGAAEVALEPAGGIGGAFDWLTGAGETAGAVSQALAPIRDLAASLAGNPTLLVIGGGLALYFVGRYVFTDELASFKRGEWS